MKRKRLWANLILLVLISSAIMFFVFPRLEFIPKLLYLAIAVWFTIWNFLQRNIKATVSCLLGTAFLLLTLPNFKVIKEVEIILIFVVWGLSAFIYKRLKSRIP